MSCTMVCSTYYESVVGFRYLIPFLFPTPCILFGCDIGVSGPAALKLSAFGARVLNEGGYRGKLVVNWLAGNNPSRVRVQRTILHMRRVVGRLNGGTFKHKRGGHVSFPSPTM